MKPYLEQLIELSPDPRTTGNRMGRMLVDGEISNNIDSLEPELLKDLVAIISISSFLYHYLCRHPESIKLIGKKASRDHSETEAINDIDTLRLYKYRELLKITWMDISRRVDYTEVLDALSSLAVACVKRALSILAPAVGRQRIDETLSIFALGKLGAHELNYSSDIDLIFVSANYDDLAEDTLALQESWFDTIRQLNRHLEERSVDGFLYRVDMKLRPWGQSGPLVMSIDDTEHYYEASSEAWERFAWLRAKVIAGSNRVGEELLSRMRPFIFKRSLSTEDLDRFVEIKNEMSRARKRRGHWNVKVGEGGIRDIEFFIQILQLVNAGRYQSLQTTNTLSAMRALQEAGLISPEEELEIKSAYLFLRRLENRLQMVDEQQTHNLPDKEFDRLKLARSLGMQGDSDDEVLDSFEKALFINRSIAKTYFEKVLPAGRD